MFSDVKPWGYWKTCLNSRIKCKGHTWFNGLSQFSCATVPIFTSYIYFSKLKSKFSKLKTIAVRCRIVALFTYFLLDSRFCLAGRGRGRVYQVFPPQIYGRRETSCKWESHKSLSIVNFIALHKGKGVQSSWPLSLFHHHVLVCHKTCNRQVASTGVFVPGTFSYVSLDKKLWFI